MRYHEIPVQNWYPPWKKKIFQQPGTSNNNVNVHVLHALPEITMQCESPQSIYSKFMIFMIDLLHMALKCVGFDTYQQWWCSTYCQILFWLFEHSYSFHCLLDDPDDVTPGSRRWTIQALSYGWGNRDQPTCLAYATLCSPETNNVKL